MKKIVMTYGLISGAIMGIYLLACIPYFKNMEDAEHSMLVGYTVMVLGFSMIYFAIARFKKLNDGNLTYGQGVKIGLQVMLISTVMYCIVWMILSYTVFPNFMDDYTAVMINKLKASGASEAKIAADTKEMKDMAELYKNPVMRFLFTFIEPLPAGVPIALITPLFLLRKKPNRNAMA